MKKMTELVLRRKQGVLVVGEKNSDYGVSEILTIVKKLSGYGYKLNEESIKGLINKDVDYDVLSTFSGLFEVLSELYDGKEDYTVFYKDFPSELLSLTAEEQLVGQLCHYIIGYVPEQIELSKDLVETTEYEDLKELNLYNDAVLSEILVDLLNTTVAMSDFDKEDMLDLLEFLDVKTLNSVFSNVSIKNKETMSLVVNFLIARKPQIDGTKLIKIPRDMLRVLSVLKTGEDTINKDLAFAEYTSQEKDFIFKTLNAMKGKEEDFKLKKYRNIWTSFFKRNNFSGKKYPQLDKYVKISFNKIKYDTYDNKLNKAIKVMNDNPSRETINAVVDLLSKRGGVFARNLDLVLRNAVKVSIPVFNSVLREFSKIEDVDSKVLIQLRNRVLNVKNNELPRVVGIKGVYTVLDGDFGLSEKELQRYDVDKVINVIDTLLVGIYSEKEELGYVTIDDSLKNIVVSTSEKGKSKQVRPMFTGSRVSLGSNCDVVRIFVSWENLKKDGRNSVDIDSSAIMYRDDFTYHSNIYYGNLYRQNSCLDVDTGVFHSGDMVDAHKGAIEYIDIDVAKLLEKGVRYVLHSIDVYSGYTFSELRDGSSNPRAGVMSLSYDLVAKESGINIEKSRKNYFEASVDSSFDISSNTRVNNTFILDLKTKEYIWLDTPIETQRKIASNVENSVERYDVLKYFVEREATTLYDLYKLHANARGVLLEDGLTDLSEDALEDEEVLITEFKPIDKTNILDTTDILANWV